MGKVRNLRHRAHVAAVKCNSNVKLEANAIAKYDSTETRSLHAGKESVFEGLDIDFKSLATRLGGDDIRSVVSSKSSTSRIGLKKKERRALRREAFLHKLQAVHAAHKKNRNRKHKCKMPVDEMKGLVQSFPTHDSDIKFTSNFSDEKGEVKSGGKKLKTLQKEALSNIKAMQQVMQNPRFLADPETTITEQLYERLKDL